MRLRKVPEIFCYRSCWKSDNYSETNQEKKQRHDTKYKAKKIRLTTLQGANEKFILILEKKNNLNFAFRVHQYYFRPL